MNISPFATFEEIPFLDHSKAYGRTVCTLTSYIDGQWQTWTQLEDGRFLKLAIVSMAQGFYFGDKEADPEDIHFQFWDFLGQHGNILNLHQQIRGLEDDFLNLAASVAKIDFLHKMQHHPDIAHGVGRLVGTEIEYIFSVCRSIFDMLQEYIEKLWKTMKPDDPALKKQGLPQSFYDMAFKSNEICTPTNLRERYGIPSLLADYYSRTAPFLNQIRDIRDDLIHRGKTLPHIFPTEKGFAVSDRYVPFAEFGVWKEKDKQPNDLSSVRPIISYAIHQTISACEDFSVTIQKCAPFPEPLAPGLKMYMKGGFLGNLMNTINSLYGDPWWPEVLPEVKKLEQR